MGAGELFLVFGADWGGSRNWQINAAAPVLNGLPAPHPLRAGRIRSASEAGRASSGALMPDKNSCTGHSNGATPRRPTNC